MTMSEQEEVKTKKSKEKEFSIADLPGVGPATMEKLVGAGYDSLLAISVSSPGELVEVGGFTENAARKIIKSARDMMGIGFESGEDLLKKREQVIKISTGSKAFDAMLGGGVETGALTEMYGAYGSGKTSVAHQLAVNVQLPKEKGGADGIAVWIDTEGTLRPEYLVKLAKAKGLDVKQALKNFRGVRAFNSILGDEEVCITNDEHFHTEPISHVIEERKENPISTFAFDPTNGNISKVPITSSISHEIGDNNELYKITTRYGRQVCVTGAHGLFKGVRMSKITGKPMKGWRGQMKPVAEYASLLKEGDHIALPRKLPIPEKELTEINLAEKLKHSLGNDVLSEILGLVNGSWIKLNEIDDTSSVTKIKLVHTGRRKSTEIPNLISPNKSFYWLLGMIIAEGNSQHKGRIIRLRINSNHEYLLRCKDIIKDIFNVESYFHEKNSLLLVPSRLLCLVITYGLEVRFDNYSYQRRIPSWLFELPRDDLKYFLHGYWEGDGCHGEKRRQDRLIFTTSSRGLAHDVTLALMRFGLVGSIIKLKFKNPKDNWNVAYRVEVGGLNMSDVTRLENTKQQLNAPFWNDLFFAKVRKIEKIHVDKKTKVYDFEVNSSTAPYQNFIGGFGGICCHNSDHQMLLAEKIEELIKQGLPVKLLIVDSLMSHFRADFSGRGELAPRQQKLNKHMHALLRLAHTYNIAIYVTNQVMAKPDTFFGDPTEAIGGHVLAHASTYRVYLRRGKKGTRVAKLVDAPAMPDTECIFQVTDEGIIDV